MAYIRTIAGFDKFANYCTLVGDTDHGIQCYLTHMIPPEDNAGALELARAPILRPPTRHIIPSNAATAKPRTIRFWDKAPIPPSNKGAPQQMRELTQILTRPLKLNGIRTEHML